MSFIGRIIDRVADFVGDVFDGPDVPGPDPRIGEAAQSSAAIGRDYLDWMKEQAGITNEWAAADRERYKSVFEPLQDDFIARATAWDTPERQAAQAAEARADVMRDAGLERGRRERQVAAMGVQPGSGRFAGLDRTRGVQTALAAAGAENMARGRTRTEAMNLRGNAVNLGSGLAVNPLSSIQVSNQGMGSGANSAMQGYRNQGSMLANQDALRMQSWQQNQMAQGQMFGALGNIAGMAMMSSDENAKTDKRPVRGVLDAVKRMRVERWRYKPGEGDGGEHIGTYAQDFTRETGLGNGRQLGVIDALGVTLGAVKELAEQVDRIDKKES